MALKYTTLDGSNLPAQFRYARVRPRRSTYVATERSGHTFYEGSLLPEDIALEWSCPGSTRAEADTLFALANVTDPYYLFIGAQDQTNDKFYVLFFMDDPIGPSDDGLYELSGVARVQSLATSTPSFTPDMWAIATMGTWTAELVS